MSTQHPRSRICVRVTVCECLLLFLPAFRANIGTSQLRRYYGLLIRAALGTHYHNLRLFLGVLYRWLFRREGWGIWLIKQGKQQITASHPGGTTKALDPRYHSTSATYQSFFLFLFILLISFISLVFFSMILWARSVFTDCCCYQG